MSTPRVLDLTLTLVDDLIASQSPATEGGHESLDFIPGATLLGAVAAKLYDTLSRTEAYQVFHAGTVRFGDGVPLAAGQPCWPMPLCWHEAKGQPAEDATDRLRADRVYWPASLRAKDPAAQPKQLREGYLRSDGLVHRPKKSLRMKTAIDPRQGRIAEAQLFGYEALQAGQQFAARIEADADLPEALWGAVTNLFAAPTELLLGRSRSAEYGRVQVARAAAPLTLPPSVAGGDALILWCLTDLALLDEHGQPTLQPTPAHLGLGRGQLDEGRTFLRFRRYASWNAYRNAFDLQRQVIRRGSVITLTGVGALTERERSDLAAGVGLYREQGLGRVCVNPAWLQPGGPVFDAPIPSTEQLPPPPRPADDALICWLEAQYLGGEAQREAERQANTAARALADCYRAARAYTGTPAHIPIGPSPAQWGSVYEAARQATDRAALRATLFDGANAVCKPRGENWSTSLRDDQGVRTFRAWFEQTFEQTGFPQLTSVEAVRLFGREAQRIAQREYRRGTPRED